MTKNSLSPIRIAHIINPVVVNETSDLYLAQPITFETMRAARDQARGEVDVKLYAACFPEDEVIVPDYFAKTRALDRSIQDILSSKTERRLPLIKDILDGLYESSAADYYIYTNVDIALMPDFYLRIKALIQKGYDGFVINRRTIAGHFSGIDDIPRIYAEAKRGKEHPGYDCFIYKRSAFTRYHLGTACIGANGIGRVILSNIMAFAGHFKVFKDLCLTFHIGDKKDWQKREFDALEQHNMNELSTILRILLNLETVKNKKPLREIHRQLVKNSARRDTPRSIMSVNSPKYDLPDEPENIYPPNPRADFSLRQDPIFVVGYPRSGTTLVQALLATQDKIMTFPETHFFCLVWRKMRLRRGKISSPFLLEALSIIRKKIPFSRNAEAYVKKISDVAGLFPIMLFEAIVVDNLILRAPREGLNTVRWMEKTPHHVFHLETILKFYPQAKIIYVLRNLEKSIISRRENLLFNNEDLWPVRKHARQWLKGVREMEKIRVANPDSLMVVGIESIVQNTDVEMRRLCNFLNIPFNPQKLGLYKDTARSLFYPWEFWKASASQGISSEIALRENDHLSPAEQHELLRVAGQKMTEYGYTLTTPKVPRVALIFLRIKEPLLSLNIFARRAARVLPLLLKRKIKKYLNLNQGV